MGVVGGREMWSGEQGGIGWVVWWRADGGDGERKIGEILKPCVGVDAG